MYGVVWSGGEFVIGDELDVKDPDADEVQVRVDKSGICHSDLLVMAREWDLPIVPGHEAAGVVVQVGAGVDSVRVGDSVAVGCQHPCGECRACRSSHYALCQTSMAVGDTPFSWRGQPTRAMARVGSFASLITVHKDQVLPTVNLPAEEAALIGCAVSTGYGNVRNVAEVVDGDTVVVIGVGGIGVNAIQTARLQGAARVIAVDVNPLKEPVAQEYGAHEFVLAAPGADVAGLAGLMRMRAGAPIDAVIECSGAVAAVEAGIQALGPGGRLALVGIPPEGTLASFDVTEMMMRQTSIRGALNGACDPFVDMPEIVRLAEAGQLALTSQVSRIWPLGELEDAIRALEQGEVVRAVLDLAPAQTAPSQA